MLTNNEITAQETQIDSQIDWIIEQPCQDCGHGLELIEGRILCPNCDQPYKIETTTIYKKKEVRN